MRLIDEWSMPRPLMFAEVETGPPPPQTEAEAMHRVWGAPDASDYKHTPPATELVK